MYSNVIESALAAAKASVGDRVKITSKSATYEGLLLPKIGLGDPNAIVLKLDSGYNIGIEFAKGASLSLIEKGKPLVFKPSSESGDGEISILGCGGTIASRVEYKTGGVFPAFSPSDLLTTFPEIKSIATIRGRKLFDLLSEDMNSAHWKIIADEVAAEVKHGAKGVVLMHGTDTMGYSAAALSFMLGPLPVPVVFVDAQRSSDRGSSDNQMNLVCAILAAKSEIAEVGLCMHAGAGDDYCFLHPGTKVRKLHTSRRDAFQTVNASPLAKMNYLTKSFEPLREKFHKRGTTKSLSLSAKMNDNVALLYTYPGIKPELIEKYSDYDGLVLASTGLGNVPANPFNDKHAKSIIPALKSLIDRGIVIVNSPQTIYGRLNMDVYTAGRMLDEIGVIGNYCDWLPETAYVKLMWVLAQTKDQKKAKELMLTNVAGEISERSILI